MTDMMILTHSMIQMTPKLSKKRLNGYLLRLILEAMVPISKELPMKQTIISKSRKTEEMAAVDIPLGVMSSLLCTTGTNLPSRYSKVKVMVVSGATIP